MFEEGVMGEKPGGGSISTYKELCSIANEMGQPDLIYKFMDLANHQASLNSKRGAAFGFAKIAKQAGEALKPHLAVLVPKLFRYQYDPNKRIQVQFSGTCLVWLMFHMHKHMNLLICCSLYVNGCEYSYVSGMTS